MNESFLHYIWKFRLFRHHSLVTNCGQAIQIIHPGMHNQHAGPDFFNARIKIGDTLWAGNVEIHIRSSDWNNHGHHLDPSYHNVILHVVQHHDKEILTGAGKLPVLELHGLIDPGLHLKYTRLLRARQWVPCQAQLPEVPLLHLRQWQSRLLVERLQRKSAEVLKKLALNRNSWEETFYQCLAKNFGFRNNALPFEMLANALPLSVVSSVRENPLRLEALIYGQAGLLERKLNDDYPVRLQDEFRKLRKKLNLTPIDSHVWKFFRLRPGNFPTIRIAQFARLMQDSKDLFSRVIQMTSFEELSKLFTLSAGPYWDDHYTFDQPVSRNYRKSLGQSSVDNIVINTVVPVMFAYGNQIFKERYKEIAIDMLEKVVAEKNNITGNWNRAGIEMTTAQETQAMLELKNEYCSHKKCLTCAIGNFILKPDKR